MLVLTRASTKAFLCLGQSGPQEARFVDEMSWEASSTITTDSLQLWYLAQDRIFAPYRLMTVGMCICSSSNKVIFLISNIAAESMNLEMPVRSQVNSNILLGVGLLKEH
jgi:hypothetical protein